MSDDDRPSRTVKNATDLQRLKLEKLMKNPEKPVYIPLGPKDKNFPKAPDFVRNVMGSSAGAGSGEFHVYRHIRRREYARQEFLNQMSEKDRLDFEHKEKIEENNRQAEEKTAKKRAKRQRAKQNMKLNRKKPKVDKPAEDSADDAESDEESDEEESNQEENRTSDNGEDNVVDSCETKPEPVKKSLKELLSKSEAACKIEEVSKFINKDS